MDEQKRWPPVDPYQKQLVILTKLTPPRLHRFTLERPRLTRRLLDAARYRLTILQAGTGYGKSTALAALAGAGHQVAWYRLDADDADPLVLLAHLGHAFAVSVPSFSSRPLILLEEWERHRGEGWQPVVDSLLNELAHTLAKPLILLLDDVHRLQEAPEALRILDRLIGRAPASLPVVIATRHPLRLPSELEWRVRGEVQEIGQSELAFSAQEIAALFGQYGRHLSGAQVASLLERTEGWPIALQLVGQQWRSGARSPMDALGRISGSASDLFTFLAQEVLAQHPADIQRFLCLTAILHQMTAASSDYLRQANNSEQILQFLLEQGLFVVDLGDGHYRYHHLFREFLQSQLPEPQRRRAHQRAAAYYLAQGADETALGHLLAAGAFDDAASLLDSLGGHLVRAGRLDSLLTWLGRLPPGVLEAHPPLLVYLGDDARLHSRFEEALAWYQQAEGRSRARGDMAAVSQALRGQARVYLDTVNPSQAERLLQEALRLTDGQADRESRARLLELLAENLLNRGRLQEAERYQDQARALRQEGPGTAELPLRMMLRTGRLAEARQLLEAQVEAERREPVQHPRAHRETLLLLSLILSFQGEPEAALRCAREGTARGQALQSLFITAVGLMRQGHAHMLAKDEAGYRAASQCFQEAITLSVRLEVPRLKVEAYWGLCQADGFRGRLPEAERLARQGIEIARVAGDEWIAACIRVTLGAALVHAGQNARASTWLAQARTAFQECADSFGETVARLWQCLGWHGAGDAARLQRDLPAALSLVEAHGYDFLFDRRSLMGPVEPRMLVPLLLEAREVPTARQCAERLLNGLGLAGIQHHPGYQLRVQALGPFRLWRGRDEVPPGEWPRQKARQLFLLLLTERRVLLERDQIVERLWPELDPESARRSFKIAHSVLCQVLEPDRRRHAPSAFILRDGSRYGWRETADMALDVTAFETAVAAGDDASARDDRVAIDYYRQAVAAYRGEYLQEYPYEEWSSELRERLLTTFLQVAERLARMLAAAAESAAGAEPEPWDEIILLCQAILARDLCWEQAYRLQMLAYSRQGRRVQALRAYQRCRESLQAELGLAPGEATRQLYRAIRTPGDRSELWRLVNTA